MGLVVRKNPNVGNRTGVGSFLSSRVAVRYLSCYRRSLGCTPFRGVVFCYCVEVFLVDCDDVALSAVNCNDYI